jgi:hypothetical protein
MPRASKIPREFYETPPGFTRQLLYWLRVGHLHPIYGRKLLDPDMTIYEPMAGDSAIVRVLAEAGLHNVLTNDIDPARDTHLHLDATLAESWADIDVDWVIMNPAFSLALPTVQHALAHTRRGVAMHVRISWEEPSKEREQFLIYNPWQGRIVLPRYQFDPTAKGTDSATTVWLVYLHGESEQWSVVAPRSCREETF